VGHGINTDGSAPGGILPFFYLLPLAIGAGTKYIRSMEDTFGDLYHDEILPMEYAPVMFVGEPDEPVYDEPEHFYDYYDDEPYDFWNPVEQGMYDDDPNPYHGDF